MKSFDNEEGIGYSTIMIGIGFVVATIALIVVAPLLNFFVSFANSLVGSTSIYLSAQTMSTFGFIVGLFALSPVIIIIGFLVGAWLESVFEKTSVGGGLI